MKKVSIKKLSLFISVSAIFYLYAPFDVFNQPGEYVIGLDLNYTPTAAGDSIFIITSSNVTLNLNNHFIQQAAGNTQLLNGVVVNANLDDVTITNGVIGELVGTGIVISEGNSQISMSDLVIDGCQTRGISAVGTISLPIQSLSINNVVMNGCCEGTAGDFVCLLQQVRRFTISDSIITGGGNTTNILSGLRIAQCLEGGQVTNVSVTSLIGNSRVSGIRLSNASKIIFTDCISGNHTAQTANTQIICFDLTTNAFGLQFKNCTASGNIATGAGSQTIGFAIQLTSTDNIFLNCIANENIATGSSIGFLFQGISAGRLENCIVRSNQSTGGFAYGCYISTSTGITIQDSSFNNQVSLTSTSVGLLLENSSDCFLIRNAFVRNLGSTSGATSFGYGLRVTPPGSGATPPIGNNVFTLCNAVRNGSATVSAATNQYSGLATNQQNVQAAENVNSIGQPWTNPGYT